MFVLGSAVVRVKGGCYGIQRVSRIQAAGLSWLGQGKRALSLRRPGCGDGETERQDSEPRAQASNLRAEGPYGKGSGVDIGWVPPEDQEESLYRGGSGA